MKGTALHHVVNFWSRGRWARLEEFENHDRTRAHNLALAFSVSHGAAEVVEVLATPRKTWSGQIQSGQLQELHSYRNGKPVEDDPCYA
jgi:hypothetical protein